MRLTPAPKTLEQSLRLTRLVLLRAPIVLGEARAITRSIDRVTDIIPGLMLRDQQVRNVLRQSGKLVTRQVEAYELVALSVDLG